MRFSSIIRSLKSVPSERTIEKRLCPDQYVGQLGDLTNEAKITSRTTVECRPHVDGLLLVLESPHIDEFNEDPAPARGKTGLNIARYLREVLGSSANDNFPIILANAVQYQCSLGCPTKYFRDEVFCAVWKNGGRENFMTRVKELYRPGDIVVCCCTKGKAKDSGKQLRQLVYCAIREALPEAEILRRTHPSFWQIKKNRDHEWK